MRKRERVYFKSVVRVVGLPGDDDAKEGGVIDYTILGETGVNR